MKKISLLLFCGILSFQIASAQTVDEILHESFESQGGLEKIKAMKTRTMKGTMNMGGMTFPGVVSEMEPNFQRVDVDIQGTKLVQAYDGIAAWTINPFQYGEHPQKMPEEEAADFVSQTFHSPFIDYQAKGHAVELEGTEEIEGAEAYKVKLTKKDGDVEYHFFDAEYYVPIMVRTTVKAGPGKGAAAETFLSDYQDVDGIMFPFFIETKMNGQTVQSVTLSEVDLSPEFEDDFFDFPATAEAPAAPATPEGAENLPKVEDSTKMQKPEKVKKKKNN